MAEPETRLEIAKQHIAEARKIVEQQKLLIGRQKQHGWDTTLSEAKLQSFERALANFEDDLAALLK